jgi:uncharacterized lipoprotein YmbA
MKVLLVAGVALLGACSILPNPKPVRYHYVVLEATGAGDPAPAREASGTVALRAVELPTYLDSDVVVRRTDRNEIGYSRDERWGEPLMEAVPRVLALDLRSRLVADDVEVLPQGSLADRWVEVSIERFEPGAGGNPELSARWTIHGRTRRGEMSGGEVRLVDREGGPAAAGMSRLLGRLGDSIAADLHASATAQK